MDEETTAAATATIDPPIDPTPPPETPANVSDEHVTLVSTPEGGAITVETSSLEVAPIYKQGILDEGTQLRLEVVLNEAQGEGKPRKVRARVPIAQRGDCLNENRRFYPWEVLKADAVRLNEKARRGELLMEGEHRSRDGKNHRLLLETVAKIGSVVAHDATKTISLEDITFVGTDAGRNLQAVVEAEIPVYVSQRAEGTAQIRVWNEDKKPYEHIQSLYGDGYDFIPPGTAGVREARVQLLLEEKRRTEGTQGEPMETKETTNPAVETKPDAAAPPVTLNEEQIKAMREQILADLEKELAAKKEVETQVTITDDAGLTEFKALREEFEKTRSEFNETKLEKERLEQENRNRKLLNETVQSEEYKRFDETQKQTLLKHIVVSGTEEDVKSRLVEHAQMLDDMIAATKLQGMGYGNQVPGVVAARIEINEKLPNFEIFSRLNEAVEHRLVQENNGDYARAGSRDRIKKMYLDQFDAMYGDRMMNEASAVAANVPQIMTFSRVVIEQVFPLLSALDLVDSMTMPSVSHVIYQEVWDQPLTADLTAMMVGEGGTAPKVGLRMRPYTLYAGDRKLAADVTPELLAMTKGIPNYDYTSKLLAGMVKDYARREDRYIYRLAVAASDMQNFVEITTFENLSQVGSTLEYASDHRMWVRWEILKVYNAETNQPTSVVALIGETTGSIHQPVVVRDGSTVLTRGYLQPSGAITVGEFGTGGAADYYVKYADGTVVLAAAPGGTVSAKYVYTTNSIYWPQTPPSGTLGAHLVTLGKAVSDAENLMEYRFYSASRRFASNNIANLITNSDRFVSSLNTPPNTLNTDNSIGMWQGKPLFKSTNMFDEKILIPAPDAIARAIFMPWILEGPITNPDTAKKSWIGVEFAAVDAILPDKLTTVTIGS